MLWLRAELGVAELLIAAAERRPADDSEAARQTLRRDPDAVDDDRRAARQRSSRSRPWGRCARVTLAELVAETPVMPEDPWGLFDKKREPR